MQEIPGLAPLGRHLALLAVLLLSGVGSAEDAGLAYTGRERPREPAPGGEERCSNAGQGGAPPGRARDADPVAGLLFVVGAVPKAVHISPVLRSLPPPLSASVLLTGEDGALLGYGALDSFVAVQGLRVESGPDHSETTGAALHEALRSQAAAVMARSRPLVVVVQGRSVSALSAAEAAHAAGTPVAHVGSEAMAQGHAEMFREAEIRRLSCLRFSVGGATGAEGGGEGSGGASDVEQVPGSTVVEQALWQASVDRPVTRFSTAPNQGLRYVLLHTTSSRGLLPMARALVDARKTVHAVLPARGSTPLGCSSEQVHCVGWIPHVDLMLQLARGVFDAVVTDSAVLVKEARALGVPTVSLLGAQVCTQESGGAPRADFYSAAGQDRAGIVRTLSGILDGETRTPPPSVGSEVGGAGQAIARALADLVDARRSDHGDVSQRVESRGSPSSVSSGRCAGLEGQRVLESPGVGDAILTTPPELVILMPVHNGMPYLVHALGTLRRQARAHGWRLLMVDDGSTDGGAAEMLRARDEDARMAYLSLGGREKGLPEALNHGMAFARRVWAPKWFAFASADNVYYENFVEDLLDVAGEWPEAGIVVAPWDSVDQDGCYLRQHVPRQRSLVQLMSEWGGMIANLWSAEVAALAGNFSSRASSAEVLEYYVRLLELAPTLGGSEGARSVMGFRLHTHGLSRGDATWDGVHAAWRNMAEALIERHGGALDLARLYPTLKLCADFYGCLLDAQRHVSRTLGDSDFVGRYLSEHMWDHEAPRSANGEGEWNDKERMFLESLSRPMARPRVLVVITGERIGESIAKGFPSARQRNYHNPLGFFDEVHVIGAREDGAAYEWGMHFHPCDGVFADIVLRTGASVVRAYGGFWTCEVAAKNRVPGVPVVCSIHDQRDWACCEEHVLLADYLWPNSGVIADKLLQIGVPSQRIFLFTERVNMTLFRNPTPNLGWRREMLSLLTNDTANGKLILHVARKDPVKNWDNVLRALALLDDSWGAVFVGPGDAEPFSLLAQQLGIRHRVHLAGAVAQERLAHLYSAADVLCNPSWFEGFAQIFLEALAAGVPVIVTSAIHPMTDLFSDERFLVDPGDAVGIAGALREAARDPVMRPRPSVEGHSKEVVDRWEVALYRMAVAEGDRVGSEMQ